MKRILIVLVNCIFVAAVVLSVMKYTRSVADTSTARDKEKFTDTTAILEEIASNYLQDSQTVADSYAAMLNSNSCSMEEAVDAIAPMVTQNGVSMQLVWQDGLTGLATVGKASNPDDHSVNYSVNGLNDLFSDLSFGDTIRVTRRYNNPQTGSYCVAFCDSVRLLDETGAEQDAILLYVMPVSNLEQHWTFPTEYGDAADVALIDSSGNYMIKPGSMKNEDFFNYVSVYNKGDIGEAALQAEMSTLGTGSFEGKNAAGELCLFAYSRLASNPSWFLISVIPESLLSSQTQDWTIVYMVLMMLGALLVLDLVVFTMLNRQERKSRVSLEVQSSIIGALSENYLNVFVVRPESDTAEVLKLDGYVTAEISRETKFFPYRLIVENYARDRVHPEEKKIFMETLSAEHLAKYFAEADSLDYPYRALIDGESHSFNAHMVRLSREGEALQLVMGFRNIDAIVAEQERSRKALEDALNAAQHANRAKTTFLNSMSHDIRTPMNAIIGFTSLAATHLDNSTLVQEYLHKIQVSSSHLLSLINDVLDMSRIESGKMNIVEKEVHLPDVLHDLRTIVHSDILNHQIDFFMDAMDVTDEDILCDKLRLSQVLMNILSNAIKFTRPGGQVSMKVLQKPSADPDRAVYVFKIRDTGIGMKPEFLAHIFEPFTREATSTVSGIQGTALGMAITKNIVDMMGGTISVTSKEGVGSEFTVECSFRKAESTAAIGPIPELTGASALVVDDDTDCCVSVCRMLTAIGMRSEWTSSGQEAIARTRYACERADPFAVYIVDWVMPDMNGVETVRQIRRAIGSGTPIIVLSSYNWEEIEEGAREAGVTHFISKPIFMSELHAVLSRSCAEKAQTPEQPALPAVSGKLLLVDDNELNQEIAETILTEAGFEVDLANDGVEAVEKMKAAAPDRYDLILMDIQMPKLDGYGASRQIRALEDPKKANIPIVAMTANAFEEDRKLALEAGMNAHVAKPIDVPVLMETLRSLLEKNT